MFKTSCSLIVQTKCIAVVCFCTVANFCIEHFFSLCICWGFSVVVSVVLITDPDFVVILHFQRF